MEAILPRVARKSDSKKTVAAVPDFLVKEMLDGQKIYYRGYRLVLKNIKTKEEIMGESTLQATLKLWFGATLLEKLSFEDYLVMVGEVGNNLSKNTNLAYDVVVFETKTLPANQIDAHFAKVPPVFVLEIDTEVEFAEKNFSEQDYIHSKTQKMLDFGVQKVVWVFTKMKKVMIATPTDDWRIIGWDKHFETIEGIVFNVAIYLKKRGIIRK